MSGDEERKALERAAYGKRITFHTRYHWILTWLEEQPGDSLADKVWRIIDTAYRASYAERGRAAMGRYWQACEAGSYPDMDYGALIAALCDALECFSRAGDNERHEFAHNLLRGVLASKAKHVPIEA
jgi:hypothetical protein